MAFLLCGCGIFARWKWIELSGMEEILGDSGEIVGWTEAGLGIDWVQFHMPYYSALSPFLTRECEALTSYCRGLNHLVNHKSTWPPAIRCALLSIDGKSLWRSARNIRTGWHIVLPKNRMLEAVCETKCHYPLVSIRWWYTSRPQAPRGFDRRARGKLERVKKGRPSFFSSARCFPQNECFWGHANTLNIHVFVYGHIHEFALRAFDFSSEAVKRWIALDSSR